MKTLVLNTDATTEHTLVIDYSTDHDCIVDPFDEVLTSNSTQARIRFTQAVSEATIKEEGTFVLRNAVLFQGILKTEQTVSMTQQNNVMIGYGSGGESVGHYNCFVGNNTNVVQGRRNIVIGHENRLLSGTNNIIIGHDASHSVSMNDTLVIGSLIEGDFVNLSLRLNASVEVTHELNVGELVQAPAFTDGFLNIARGNIETGNVTISSELVQAPAFTDGFLNITRGNIETGNVTISSESVQAPAFTDGFLNITRGNIETGNVTISSESVQAPAFTDGFLNITRGELQIPEENVSLYFDDGSFKYRLHDKVYRIMSVEEV